MKYGSSCMHADVQQSRIESLTVGHWTISATSDQIRAALMFNPASENDGRQDVYRHDDDTIEPIVYSVARTSWRCLVA